MKKIIAQITCLSMLLIAILFASQAHAQTGCHASFGVHQSLNTLTLNFADSSSSPNTITSWAWDFGDGSTSTDQSPHHTYAHDGTYTVCLTMGDAHGCSNTICNNVTLTAIAQPGCHALFGLHPFQDLTANFADLSTGTNAISFWAWDFGDGGTSNDQSPHHTYVHDGTYNVCLTISDGHGCSDKYCHPVTVHIVAQPNCKASFNFHQTANSLSANFTDASTGNSGITSWTWDFGDGSTSTLQNPLHTYTSDGNYAVCLTTHDGHGCTDTYCHPVTINAGVSTGCHALFGFHQSSNTLTANFVDSSIGTHTLASWAWDFGDGHTSTDQNPHHTYAHDGTYNVCLTVHDGHGCSSTVCHQITVNPSASVTCHAAFSFHQSVNALEINFSDASSGSNSVITWQWDYGDGNVSNTQNPSHTYAHDGTYNVFLTIHDGHGCSNTVCHQVTVHSVAPPCHAGDTFHADSAGNIIYFTNTSTGTTNHTTYSWDFGDGYTSTDENPQHNYSHMGSYLACLFIHDSITGCSSHSCHVVHYNHHAILQHALVHHSLAAIAHFSNKFGSETDVETLDKQQYIVSYPNPFSASGTIDYELAYDADVKIEIYDLLGNIVSQVINEHQTEGTHVQAIQANNFNSGFYLVKMLANGELFTKKISVLK